MKAEFDDCTLRTDNRGAAGRDELNLAEFPLAALADRAPKGQKTLVFEDTVWDKGAGQRVVRRLTISASDRYGLPTAVDDEVILGLVQLTRQRDFADRTVAFSRYELINVLGWRREGKSYRRIDQSLRRWLGVTLYYDKAWWDKEAGCWIDAAFHLLDQITLARRRKGETADAAQRRCSSTFTWNEIIFRSFQAGYLKQLDMTLYRSLHSTIAKRMLRFLDKRFYHRSRWEFPLVEFACEHIGLSRNYDVGQLKRRLMPAIAELEGAGVIGQMTPRFVRLGPGNWIVAFSKGSRKQLRRTADATAGVVKQLTDRGVSARVAHRLAAEFPEHDIAAQTAAFDELIRTNDPRAARNPAGFLVASIRNHYRTTTHATVADAVMNSRRTRRTSSLDDPNGSRGTNTDEAAAKRVTAFLAALRPDERKVLEHEAEQSAPAFLRDSFRRASADGSTTAREAYRSIMLRQHVLRILDMAAATSKR